MGQVIQFRNFGVDVFGKFKSGLSNVGSIASVIGDVIDALIDFPANMRLLLPFSKNASWRRKQSSPWAVGGRTWYRAELM